MEVVILVLEVWFIESCKYGMCILIDVEIWLIDFVVLIEFGLIERCNEGVEGFLGRIDVFDFVKENFGFVELMECVIGDLL